MCSQSNCTLVLASTPRDIYLWEAELLKSGWKVWNIIYATPNKYCRGAIKKPNLFEIHTAWIVAYKGTILKNPIKNELESCFRKGLLYTNSIEYEPTTTFIGPKLPGLGHFRGSQKSIDLLTKLLKLLVSPTTNTFKKNLYLFDPFMGTSSIGEVCNSFYIHYIGNDQDPVALEVSQQRLSLFHIE